MLTMKSKKVGALKHLKRFGIFAALPLFVFGIVLVLMMVFRPQGLIPRRGAKAGIEKRAAGEVSGG